MELANTVSHGDSLRRRRAADLVIGEELVRKPREILVLLEAFRKLGQAGMGTSLQISYLQALLRISKNKSLVSRLRDIPENSKRTQKLQYLNAQETLRLHLQSAGLNIAPQITIEESRKIMDAIGTSKYDHIGEFIDSEFIMAARVFGWDTATSLMSVGSKERIKHEMLMGSESGLYRALQGNVGSKDGGWDKSQLEAAKISYQTLSLVIGEQALDEATKGLTHAELIEFLSIMGAQAGLAKAVPA